MVEKLLLLRGRPAYYRIYLQGILNPDWARDYVDLKLECVHLSATEHVTTLKGEVFDQAELMGILNMMYDLGLPLLGVECFPYLEESI
jgi:hypothetical protein